MSTDGHDLASALRVCAPLAGTAVALRDVPDPVFAQELVGPGVAIDPPRTGEVTAVAPVSGTVAKIHPHAFVIAADDPAAPGQADPAGRAVLVHLGLDTVRLGGEGFTVHAAQGERVQAGDPVVTWNPAVIEAGGLNPIVPLIALQASRADVIPAVQPGAQAACGAELLTWSSPA